MPAYLIAHVDVTDPEAYREYALHTPRVIARHGGRMLVRNGTRVVLEGEDDPRRVIVVEFPSLDAARAFHASPDYVKLRAIRAPASRAQLIVFDGFPAEAWADAVAASDKLTL